MSLSGEGMNKKEILVVAGGRIKPLFLQNIIDERKRYIIGVDKGLEILDRLGVEANLAVGDFDSVSFDIKQKYLNRENTVLLNAEKDYSDTHIAILEALKQKPDTIIIAGATGGRIDHMLANISLLGICEAENVFAYIIDEYNKIRITNKPVSIKKTSCYGKYISLIPYTDKVTGVNLSGFKYKLTDATLVRDETIGISNEIEREEGFITFKSGRLIVIESKD